MSRVISHVQKFGAAESSTQRFISPTNPDTDEDMKLNRTISLLIAVEAAGRLLDKSHTPHPWEERGKGIVLR